jgi:hypothetical protein
MVYLKYPVWQLPSGFLNIRSGAQSYIYYYTGSRKGSRYLSSVEIRAILISY